MNQIHNIEGAYAFFMCNHRDPVECVSLTDCFVAESYLAASAFFRGEVVKPSPIKPGYVVEHPDGHLIYIRDMTMAEEATAAGWKLVATQPHRHVTGRFSYMCDFSWCTCTV